ncbi:MULTISPECIES: CHASE3 domain-containing protein [Variovorax]|jgi:signal transduction histidine kinase|uniref:Signal transduction histidine kinase n=3 Tax=Variovorax paradoxus TaxID=34073 RepID=A0AAW8EKS9_VARPD|nr:CHASE3 domain-containing protein [Variovorax paradoxus]MBW8718036.1 CHASE3 domain-containing protein [Variovorax paradoxus]MDP9973448.1 signal transduction histidine kinase [Variovorax paradoxus]
MAVSLLLAALAALALVGINEAGYRQSSRALADIDAALKVRGTLNQILQNMLDAETGQRGYLLTGEASYRQPYDTAVKQVDGHLAALRQLYAERPAERTRLAELSKHVLRKIAEMDMSVRLRQDGKDEAWKFVITTDVGREEMDSIRKAAGELAEISNQTLHQSQIQVMKSLRLARIGTAIVALAAFLAFFLYLRQAHALRSIGERQQETLQRERNALEDEVRERTASLAELATHLQDVRETERGYLARELHDELGSLLTAAKLDVARLKSRLLEAPDATQRLQHLTELLNSGIALKRRIIEDLRPSSLSNLGLVASLEILGREFAERSGIQVQMVLEPVAMDESRQLTIYRMVQESLTNIGKYAEASEATIVLKNYENHAVVEVADNGKGFDPQRIRPSTHGLAGMRHRVEAARGRLTISSTPGRGTRVSAMLPIAKTL